MPLTVCRCCGGKMEPEVLRHNPNVCPSCERLLEDDSPDILIGMTRMKAVTTGADELIDQPGSLPNPPNAEPKPTEVLIGKSESSSK